MALNPGPDKKRRGDWLREGADRLNGGYLRPTYSVTRDEQCKPKELYSYMGNTYLYSCIHVLIRVFGPRVNTECK